MTKVSNTTKPRQLAPAKRKQVLTKVRSLLPGELGRVHHYKNPVLMWPMLGSFTGFLNRHGAEILLQLNTINRGLTPGRLNGFLEEIRTRTFHRPKFSLAWVADTAKLTVVDGGGRGTAIAESNINIEVDYDIYYVRNRDEFFELYRTFDHVGRIRNKKDDCEVKALQLQLPSPRSRKIWPPIATAIAVYLHGKHYEDLRADDIAQLLDDELLERDLLYDRFFKRYDFKGTNERLRHIGVMAAYLHAYDQDSTLADEFFLKMLSDVDEERALPSSLPRRLRRLLLNCVAGVGGKSRSPKGHVMRGHGGWLATAWEKGWEPYVAGKHRTPVNVPAKELLFPECQRR